MFSDLRSEVVVCFVDVDGIVDQYINFLFIILLYLKLYDWFSMISYYKVNLSDCLISGLSWRPLIFFQCSWLFVKSKSPLDSIHVSLYFEICGLWIETRFLSIWSLLFKHFKYIYEEGVLIIVDWLDSHPPLLNFSIFKYNWCRYFKFVFRVRVMVFKATFNNISVISWLSVLLVEETWVPTENHRPVTSHWQTLSHKVVSSTPHHEQDSNSQQIGTDCI